MADRVPLDFDPPVRVLRSLLLGVDDDRPDRADALSRLDRRGPARSSDGPVPRLHPGGPETHRRPGTAEPPPEPSASHLSRHWRSRLPVLLEELATAWKDPAAWTGTSQAGGVTMPATALGTVAHATS